MNEEMNVIYLEREKAGSDGLWKLDSLLGQTRYG